MSILFEELSKSTAEQAVAFIDAVLYLEQAYRGHSSKEKCVLSKYSLMLRDMRDDLEEIGYRFDPTKALEDLLKKEGLKLVEVSDNEEK